MRKIKHPVYAADKLSRFTVARTTMVPLMIVHTSVKWDNQIMVPVSKDASIEMNGQGFGPQAGDIWFTPVLVKLPNGQSVSRTDRSGNTIHHYVMDGDKAVGELYTNGRGRYKVLATGEVYEGLKLGGTDLPPEQSFDYAFYSAEQLQTAEAEFQAGEAQAEKVA